MNALTRLSTIDDAFDDILQGFFRPARGMESGPSALQPRIDVWARDDAFAITVELPGIKRENIDISISGNEVSINAEATEIKEQGEKVRQLYGERRYGKYQRTIVLPHEVDQNQCQAKYNDGVLELVLPFNQNVLPKKIQVS
mgnify:CR=1 FL=1